MGAPSPIPNSRRGRAGISRYDFNIHLRIPPRQAHGYYVPTLAKAFVFRWTVDGELTRDQPVSERIPMICIGTAMMPKRELKYLLTP